jgi:16S rRNA (guanine966-N2)-methyltransferase
LRIIAGKYRSRKILGDKESFEKAPGVQQVLRPTTDRARESLFNILSNIVDFENLKCLDLFAGTGAIGFEFLSRGADSVDFVEISAQQVGIIESNAKSLDCLNQVKIYKEEVNTFLVRKAGTFYDVIFADPPYKSEYTKEIPSKLFNLGFSVFVLECGPGTEIDLSHEGYEYMERKTGITNFKILISKD